MGCWLSNFLGVHLDVIGLHWVGLYRKGNVTLDAIIPNSGTHYINTKIFEIGFQSLCQLVQLN